MTDLAGFLLARLAEDEAAAQAAAPNKWTVNTWKNDKGVEFLIVPDYRDSAPAFGISDQANAVHIARHDPARVLAEVAAKRRIVEHCAGMLRESVEWDEPTQATDAKHTLRLLAQPYAGHEDFQEEWRV